MSVPELASIDGRITQTSEARVPASDDGLLRGDGVFEVIRLYAGSALRPRRAPGPAGALRSRPRAAGGAGASFEREIAALLAELGEHEAQLRLVLTRGGRRIASIEQLPALGEVGHARERHLLAHGDPDRRQVPLLRRRTCRRRGSPRPRAPTRPSSSGPTASCSSHRLRRSSGSPPTGSLRTPSLEAGILASITRARIVDVARRSRRASSSSTTCCGAERGVPRLVRARGPAGRHHRRHRARAVPATGPHEAREAFAARASPRLLVRPEVGMDLDLTDEQRLISETARDFADNEIVPRARENDRAERFDLELARGLGEMGYLGAPVAEEYGGRGLDYLELRADRRADRPRRLVGADGRLGPDLARRRLDRALGHRGAEAAMAAAALLRRVRSAASASPSRTPAPTRLDCERVPRRPTAAGRSAGTKMWISIGNVAERRPDLRPDRPGEEAPGHRLLPRPDRRPWLHRRRRSTASSGCGPPTPRSSRSTTSRSPTTRCSARSATASRSR